MLAHSRTSQCLARSYREGRPRETGADDCLPIFGDAIDRTVAMESRVPELEHRLHAPQIVALQAAGGEGLPEQLPTRFGGVVQG
jgi:hypothetical protein